MTSDQSNGQPVRAAAAMSGKRGRKSAGSWRRRRPWLEALESRRLLSVNIAEFPIRSRGGTPQGVATGAGTDTNLWFTLSSNNIGMINPSNPSAGVTQYPIPTYNSGPGPITAGPDGNYWFFEATADQFGVINPTTGHITEIPLLSAANPGVDGMTAGPNGTIWFTEYNTNQVGVINTATDQISLIPAITPGAQPYGIVEGPDGNMWFTEAGANQVGTINPTTHVVQEFPIDSSGNDDAEGIAVGPNNDLWFTLTGTDKIGVMNPTTGKMVAEYSVPTANAKPNAIAPGPGKANMWFTEPGTDKIAVIGPTGTVYEAYTYDDLTPIGIVLGSDKNIWYVSSNQVGIDKLVSGVSTPYAYTSTSAGAASGIAADGSGDLWFTQSSSGQVGVFDPATDISTEFGVQNDVSGPQGIALGPDSNIWFTEYGYDYTNGDQIGSIKPSNAQITQYAVDTANADPDQIVSDPADGNLWFTEYAADKIGRINPTTKAVAEYAVPTASAEPAAIAVDASGNIWFTEYNADRIGEFSPNTPNSITEYDIPGRPTGIVAGPDGNIWFTELLESSPYTYQIGVFSPKSDTVIDQYPTPGDASASAIIVGPDKNLWFAEGSDRLGTITTAGVITSYAVPNAQPVALFSGPDGNLWFAGTGVYNYNTGVQYPNIIGVVTLTPAATPTQLAVATQPPGSVTAAKGFGLVISVEDAAGNPDTDYTGSVTIALSNNPTGDTLKGTLTEPVVDGEAIFSGLTLTDAGTGYTIQATASGLSPVTTGAFNVTLGATQLIVTGQPPKAVGAGVAFGMTVSAEDGQGNVDTSYDGPITLTLGNHPTGGMLSGVLVIGATDGVATFTGLSLNVPAEDYTILASSGTLTSATSIGFNVTAGPATQLQVATGGEPPASVLAGGLFSVSLVADDQSGDLATGFNGSVTLALVNSGGVNLQGNVTASAQGGKITFSGLSIDTVGDYTIQATSTGLSSVTTSFVNVTPGAATQLVVAPGNPPSTVAAGATFGFTVDAEDAFDNIDPTFSGSVALAVMNHPGITLHGSPTATAQSGVATFSGLSIDTAGTFTIQATSGSLAAGTTPPITVTGGTASGLVVTAQPPGTITAGSTFGLTVGAVDQYGNPTSSFGGSVTVALANSPGVTLNGTLSEPAQGGIATFSGLSIDTAGTYTIQASGGGLIRATSNSIIVTAAQTGQLVIHTPPSSTATAGAAFPTQPVIYVEDANGNLETGDNTTQVTASVASGPGTLQGTTTVTVKGGIATFTDLYDRRAGTITLSFSGDGLTVGPSSNIVVSPATASQLVIQTQPAGPATAGQPFATQPVIYEEDAFHNIETGDNSTVITATLATGAGPLQGATATVSGGVATFTGLADQKVETITLAFTGGGLTSATSGPVTVVAGAATQLVITTQPYASVVAGNPLTDPIVVQEEDQYGNPVTSDNTTQVTASLASGAGTLIGTTTATVQGGIASFNDLEDDTAGALTLQFSAGTLPPVTSDASIVKPGPASHLIVKRKPGGVISGQAFSLEVDALDPYNNVDTSYNGSVTVSSPTVTLSGTDTMTASAGVAQFTDVVSNTSGDISLAATSGTLTTGTTGGTTVTVSPAVPTQFVVNAQPAATVTAGQGFATTSQPVVVYEEDQYGNVETGDNSTVVTASLSDTAAKLLGTTTATVSGGVATFTALSTETAGTMTLAFNGDGLKAGSSHSIVISPAAASQLVIQTQPSPTATAGQPFGIQPVVAEEDKYGNVEAGDNSTSVSASLGSGAGPLLGTTSVALQGGVATFAGLYDKTAETITLTFAGGGLTSAPTDSIVVSPAVATQLVLHAQPSSTATAGQPFATLPVIYEEDQYGNVETGDNSTVMTATLTGGVGPLIGSTATVSSGVATFTGLADVKAETISLKFSGNGLTVAAPTNIVVSPAAAAKLVIQTQPSPTATAGQPLAIQPVIAVEDQYGNLEPGDNSTVMTVSLGSGTGALQGTTTATVSGGVATFAGLAENVAGTITLEFTGGGLAAAISNAVNVSAAPATQLVVTTPPPSSLAAGQSFSMVVSAEDPYGNVATSFDGTVTIALPGQSGSTIPVQAADGVATFTGLTLDPTAQGHPIQVTGGGLTAASTGPVAVNSVSNAQPPTITGEAVVTSQKKNKKGKPVGKPVLQGFTLDFSTAMNAASAESAGNYRMTATSTKHAKKKTMPPPTLVPFTARYNAATNSVTLTLAGKQAFAKGGQITVTYSAVTSASGASLDSSDAAFTIQPKGTGVTPI